MGTHHSMLGYPEDKRSDDLRLRRFGSVLGDVDRQAARVVARLLGERVIIQDDGSKDRTPDLRIEYLDGRTGVVEVVADIDRRHAEMWELVIRRHHQIRSRGLQRTWFVTLGRHADLRQVDRLLPVLLRRLEHTSTSVEVLDATLDGEELRQLGVVAARWAKPGNGGTPGIHVSPEGASGPSDVPVMLFSDALDAMISDTQYRDVWRKLDEAEADERHVFFGLTFTSAWSAYRLLRHDSRELPARLPALPASVSHLWLMNVPFAQRCLHWSSARGWIDTRQHWTTE